VVSVFLVGVVVFLLPLINTTTNRSVEVCSRLKDLVGFAIKELKQHFELVSICRAVDRDVVVAPTYLFNWAFHRLSERGVSRHCFP
jgi:hypothetical protein